MKEDSVSAKFAEKRNILYYSKVRSMTHFLNVPGLYGSGENHWQTIFEQLGGDSFKRINQSDWNHPNIEEWADNIDKFIEGYDLSNLVLIGHSMGCVTIAKWANKYNRRIKGALLVAPADLENKEGLMEFTNLNQYPNQQLGFKSIVVASSNDPWASIDRSKYFADRWGSDFVDVGPKGHINEQSGHGKWEEGWNILKTLE